MTPSTTNTAAREVVDLAPNAPRPWRVSDRLTFEILDANGDPVGAIYGPDKDRQENMAIIVNAVNTLTQQQGGEQEARAFLAAEVSDGHIDMDFVRSKDAIRAISAALRSKQPAASEGVDSEICMRLVQIVEGGGLTWRDSSGNHRLKDTPDWVAFYCATKNAREREASANTSKQAAGEAVAGWRELGDWYNTLCHGLMYLHERSYGNAETAFEDVIRKLEALRNSHGPDASFHSLATTPPRHPADDGATFSVTITDGGWKGSLEEWQARRKPTIGEQLDAALAGREAGEAGLG